ncbi:restriction endonuclease [Lactobacillus delbrueckii]|uniref:type III restriction-modification system endonuclease n=1 Tax=Lactobacillus delbrueckii TaxID=1584 RepID=UPI001F266228|nr:DEAD/DEAH box helicase family protein [Lactobacillus delbrueckii]GHN21356.1 restriction endonuclease [Lactobacillus delbrueckii]GHN23135.1 restriction endonuclease [Lactobacillus delbrueckii]GHN62119.1 restriction endonuclease [Lactobacillus delbrueckii]
MADMKFKFTIQQYQTDAVNSVVDVFKGQPKQGIVSYRRDVGKGYEIKLSDSEVIDNTYLAGFSNSPVALSSEQLLSNIRKVQKENNIKESTSLAKHMGACSLDVEMETGTGKTYVYIKTMFELNERYGWSKFIVVVPSIAIREGVQKSFKMMEDHFMNKYGKKADFFVYNSKNLTEIDDFSSRADLSVMIINVQAFNARGKDARRIRMELDEFESRKPIDVIKANRPIVILDEPQKMGGKKTQESLKEFNPLFTLNYSATHKEHHDLVYVLDALDAYKMKLVKKIEVKGFDIKNLRGTDGYLYLENIVISPDHPPRARLEFEIKYNKSINREVRILSVDDDLYALSKGLEQYQGYHINDIDPINGLVTFTNGVEIHTGEVQGDASEKDIRRVQIRETIRSHFEKEKELYNRGIKTLSLFFIDKVEHYRKYDEEGNEVNSEYGQMFEEEYNSILNEYLTLFDTPYEKYLKSIDVKKTHAGYFSIDKKGHKIDSKIKRGSDISDDESAYELILKDKEKLLSFDNPVRFIFSHSALREGWDNPNVFQICTLKHGGDSTTNKRQEVGRGLRICVNQDGDRMDEHILGAEVQDVNKLTVIASDGYKDFVSSLQKEIKDDLYERPTKITLDFFENKQIKHNDEVVKISKEQSNVIMHYLIKNDYIDDDHVTDTYRTDVANNTLKPLPEKYGVRELTPEIHALVQSVYDDHAFDDFVLDGRKTKIPENNLNDNFNKEEFQKLWQQINHKYSYTVHFDSKELIENSVNYINSKLYVAPLQYTVTKGTQGEEWSSDSVKAGSGFVSESRQTYTLTRGETSQVKYDLIGKISAGTHLTRRTVVKILKTIQPAKFKMYQYNPEEFISKVIKLINEQKATMIVDDITYNETEGRYDSSIFTLEKNHEFSKAYRAKKNVQDYVFADGSAEKSVERKFAEDMDLDDKVAVYAKLPRGFQIPTPVGNYAPDWAIAFKKGSVKHIYFIAETKGSLSSMDLRPIEQAKIKCAKKLFNEMSTTDVIYEQVDSFNSLLDMMNEIPDKENTK